MPADGRESDLSDRIALGHPGEELVRPLVEEEQCRAFGAQHACRLGHDPLEEHVEIELGGDVRDEPEELHLLGATLVDVLEVGCADERGGRLAGHALEQGEVLEVIAARPLVEHLDDADHGTPGGRDRRTHEVACRVPGQLVDLPVEPWVGVRIVDDERLVRREDPSCDPDVVEHADLESLIALCDT